jgi:hypothetical protein
MYWRCVFGAAALGLAATAALAAPEDYCKAYAIDFADQTKRDTAYWKQRFDDAEKSCLERFTFVEPAEQARPQQVAKRKPKPKAATAETPVEPAQEDSVSLAEAILPDEPPPPSRKKKKKKPEEGVIVLPDTPPPPKRNQKLTEGSLAWLDYCDRKYASFNRATGTYTSHSGVERKCLVTANFQ